MRNIILAIVALAIAPVAAAQPAAAPNSTPEVLSSVYHCASVSDDHERLACFDAAVGRLHQAESQGQVVAVDRQQVSTIEHESFGFSLPSLSRLIPRLGNGGQSAPIDTVSLQVQRVAFNADGRARFIMSNGQVWTQVEQRSPNNVRPGDTVTVRRALLGSFMLIPAHGGQAHRVHRDD